MTTPTYSPARLAICLLLLLITVRYVGDLAHNTVPARQERSSWHTACVVRTGLACKP